MWRLVVIERAEISALHNSSSSSRIVEDALISVIAEHIIALREQSKLFLISCWSRRMGGGFFFWNEVQSPSCQRVLLHNYHYPWNILTELASWHLARHDIYGVCLPKRRIWIAPIQYSRYKALPHMMSKTAGLTCLVGLHLWFWWGSSGLSLMCITYCTLMLDLNECSVRTLRIDPIVAGVISRRRTADIVVKHS